MADTRPEPEHLLCPRCQQWTLRQAEFDAYWRCVNEFCRYIEDYED